MVFVRALVTIVYEIGRTTLDVFVELLIRVILALFTYEVGILKIYTL